MFWQMGIRPLYLDEALGANWLIAATSLVQVRWIINKADGAFFRAFIQKHLEGLTVDIRIRRQL